MHDQATAPGSAGVSGDAASAEVRRVTFRRGRREVATTRLAVSIHEAAAMLGVSYMTLWRGIRAGQFPAVRMRDRILVPIKAVEALLETAFATGELVDAPEWTAGWQAEVAGGAAGVA